ncbi:unnamed protein product, partial [marine sediment metagenome]
MLMKRMGFLIIILILSSFIYLSPYNAARAQSVSFGDAQEDARVEKEKRYKKDRAKAR